MFLDGFDRWLFPNCPSVFPGQRPEKAVLVQEQAGIWRQFPGHWAPNGILQTDLTIARESL